MNKRITVFGATGMLGVPVTKQLIVAGFEVTALVRDVEKGKKMFPQGITFVEGDLQNKSDVKEVLKNADAVYLNLSTDYKTKKNEFSPEREGLDNILSAAKEAGVKQVVFLSSFIARNYTGDFWLMKTKKAGIEKVKNSGIPYTIFYPSNFMENFNGSFRVGKKINIIGKSYEKLWWIAGEDYGRQVVNALKNDTALNREYPVQGPEPMTSKEAAEVFIKNYTKEDLKIAYLPMGMAKFLSLFIKKLQFAVPMMEVINNNKETFESQQTWDELGKPVITLSGFAAKQPS